MKASDDYVGNVKTKADIDYAWNVQISTETDAKTQKWQEDKHPKRGKWTTNGH